MYLQQCGWLENLLSLYFLKPHIENLIKSTKKYGIRKKNLKNILKDLINKNLYKGPDNLFRIALNKKLISVSLEKDQNQKVILILN